MQGEFFHLLKQSSDIDIFELLSELMEALENIDLDKNNPQLVNFHTLDAKVNSNVSSIGFGQSLDVTKQIKASSAITIGGIAPATKVQN